MDRMEFSKWSDLRKIVWMFDKHKFQLNCQNIITFDTETANGFLQPDGKVIAFDHALYELNREIYENSTPVGLMYIWQIAIETLGGWFAFYGRTWDELVEFLTAMTCEMKYYACNARTSESDYPDYFRYVDGQYELAAWQINATMWVHNLGFDFEFLRNVFEQQFSKHRTLNGKKRGSVFARAPHRPMYAKVTHAGVRIKFRDSLVLTQKSLANWGEDAALPVKKKSEPKDFYLPIRTPETPLNDDEMQYSLQDVVTMIYGLQKYREKWGTLENIPNTQTGEVRRKCVENIAVANPAWASLCYSVTNNYTLDFYRHLHRAFIGGWVHANMTHAAKLLYNIRCYDFTSSYPAVMTSQTFPLTDFIACDTSEFEHSQNADLLDLDLEYHYLYHLRVKGVKSIISNSFWSLSKCQKVSGEMVDNGKLRSASEMEITITDLDWEVFRKAYNFKEVECIHMWKSKSGLLPREFILTILDYYEQKTQLKNVDGRESDYAFSKQVINGIYGVCVTKIVADSVDFVAGEGWHVDKSENFTEEDFHEIISATDEHKSYVTYQIGVWVTAWARHNLWDAILRFDDKVVYCDTDSSKGLFTDNDLRWFDTWNKKLEIRQNEIARRLKFSPELYAPKNNDAEICRIGVWDREKDCLEFKTLGAKRYCYKAYNKKGEIQLYATIAGLPKLSAVDKFDGDITAFSTGIRFDTVESGKSIAHYNNNQPLCVWVDRDGKEFQSSDRYGVCIQPTTFDLSISEEYRNLLRYLAGEIEVETGFIDDPDFLK